MTTDALTSNLFAEETLTLVVRFVTLVIDHNPGYKS